VSLRGSFLRAATAVLVVFVACAATACGDQGPSLAERAAAARAAQEAADQKAREQARAEREAGRLAAAWRYQEATVGGGSQVTAAIFATDDVDVDGTGAHSVQLIFRDHQKWGRSAYLVLQRGDFACRPRCTVGVSVDDGTPRRLEAWRPETDEAIAMFIRDTAAFWRLTGDAQRLSITFPVTAGGTRTASFAVSGLDESKMPGW
jgi:muconolactone delta-isomerase